MEHTIPTKCPSCGEEMRVCLLKCPACATEVQGAFPLDRFSRLSPVQMDFLEIFIRCRGSLKDVGNKLGISYPTARNRLDSLIEALDFENKNDLSQYRLEILKKLKEGDVTAEEALNLLEGGKNHDGRA